MNPSKENLTSSQLFELGKLYYDRTDFKIAIEKIREASELYFAEKDIDQYLECQNMLLRMHAERCETDEINTIKEHLQDLVLKEGYELTSKTFKTLGVCALYKYQQDVALDYFQKALSKALAEDNKEDICCAIHEIAKTYYIQDRLSDSIKEIYNLKVFFEVLDMPRLKIINKILNGHILRKMHRYEEALEIFWECHAALNEEKNIMDYVSLLYGMGLTYHDMGENDLSHMYLKLASNMANKDDLKRVSESINKKMKDFGVKTQNAYDLVFDIKSNMVTERQKGKVDFKNQFILLDLLHLFMKHPGRVFSKENLVQMIWKQEYNPAVHDNKIYVTIKRLRKMIEPDYDKPRYVFRAKNGYYLNKTTKVLLESDNLGSLNV